MMQNDWTGAGPSTVQGRQASQQGKLEVDPLETSLLFTLRRLQAMIMQDFTNRFDALDLRPIQLGTLLLIRNNPGSRQSDIAAALGIQRPNFVTMMDELDGRGLTRRTPAPRDRRSYSLSLTAKGQSLVAEALRLMAEHEAAVTRTLPPAERDTLVSTLNRLEQALAGTGSR